ncbi:MAG: phytoene/squalene synthase family protein [Gemmatimonadota bacterium]|nr:phytoene/squalene synthase family protein [Gemmatimonadota bacterium]MDH4350265.1 phytoene/squalene synthase family protein [Gemmatimonadota bacterium]
MLGGGAPADREFCRAILPKVSRTFALGIRLLPAPLEEAVRTSYLLCRIADTIEDATALPADRKRDLLVRFRVCLDTPTEDGALLAAAFARAVSDEDRLVRECDRVLRAFHALSAEERAAVRPWVQEMATGMAEFAARRGTREGIAALATVAELDRYCYYVAGTVGHLLTDLFRIHHRQMTATRYERLDALATSFGLGLQLTNIIKDVADDRRRGWSFVPRDLCEVAGLGPDDLQDPSHGSEARRVMEALIAKAKAHLRDALAYCTTLPAAAYRIRIFCLTSLYFAIRTLRIAERDPRLLDPTHKVKITRAEVYRTVAATHLIAPFDPLVRSYYLHLAGRS